jgi:hypothetical protein
MSAVWPLAVSVAFGSAPRSSSTETASTLPEVERRTAVEQRRDHCRVSRLAGDVKRGIPAEPRRRADVRAGEEEHAREVGIAVGGGPVQRGHAVPLRAAFVSRAMAASATGAPFTASRVAEHTPATRAATASLAK